MTMSRLHRADAVLIVIDVQEKLMPVINGHAAIARNIERLVRGCKVLDVPTLLTEQYVKGLGATIAPIRKAFEETSEYEPIEKTSFSGWGCAEFVTALRPLHQRKQAVVAGIETHVCVYQTVVDLLANGYAVTIVADAVGSRSKANKDVALQRMSAEGAKLSSTEMVLFEMLGVSGTDEFWAIAKLVK
jgi:nicotinamidase-related amidase